MLQLLNFSINTSLFSELLKVTIFCNSLPSRGTLYNVLNKFENLDKKSLENILIEENKDKNNLEILILKYYFKYCEQLNLKFTADSFARFINFEIGNDVIYCEKLFFESG